MFFRGQRLGRCQRLWVPAVGLGIRSLVYFGRRYLRRLEPGWRHVRLVRGSLLGRVRLVLHSAGTAAEGRVIGVGNRASLNNRPVNEGSVDVGLVHIDHRGVIGEIPAAPLAARKPHAQIPAAVVHPAVVAHGRTPVARVIAIVAVVVSPIAGRP